MKHLTITLTLAFVALAGFAQYHIRVECDGVGYSNEQWYNISYTTNNWIGEKQIQEIRIDEIGFNRYPDDQHTFKEVSTFKIYSPDKKRLIEIARNFKTYQDVLNYNSKLMITYNKLKAKFLIEKNKVNYPIPHPKLIAKKECCKPVNVY